MLDISTLESPQVMELGNTSSSLGVRAILLMVSAFSMPLSVGYVGRQRRLGEILPEDTSMFLVLISTALETGQCTNVAYYSFGHHIVASNNNCAVE